MACFGPDRPDTRNYGNELGTTLGSQAQIAPSLLAREQQYEPQYTDLSLSNLGQYLNGTPGRPGLVSLYGQAASGMARGQAAADLISRRGDVNSIEQLGGRATSAILAADPYQRALLGTLNSQANSDLAAGTSLTPEQLALTQQASRAASASRGLGYGPSDVFSETLGALGYGTQMQAQRRAFASGVAGLNQSVIGDPFMAILGRSSGANGQVPGLLGMGHAAGQNLGPQLFNPESGYSGNLNASNQAYQWQYNQSQPSTMSRIGQVGSSVGSLVGGIAGGLGCWVAREVYGAGNARWLVFRNWLQTKPWLLRVYTRHGPVVAGWLKRWPWLKAPVKALMEVAVNGRLSYGY